MGALSWGDAIMTDIGGFGCRFQNLSGSLIKKGSAVAASSANDFGVVLQTTEYECIGFAYEDIPVNEYGYVIVAGVAQALLKDTTAATKGYWAKCSATDGRIEVTTAPSGLGALSTAEHFKEVGHCMETKSAGTDVLVKILVHPL